MSTFFSPPVLNPEKTTKLSFIGTSVVKGSQITFSNKSNYLKGNPVSAKI